MSHQSHPLKMAGKGAKYSKIKLVAKLVTENRQPCVFCQQDVDDEVIFGKLYSLGDIQCHYFCVLLSCCLVQKGKDTEGLFGFLYKDIMAEVERSKKHKCSYCGRGGASMGCSVSQCRKQFHLPCGRQKNVVSLFYGNYKSFCELHAPKQKISNEVMANAKLRMKRDRMAKASKPSDKIEEIKRISGQEETVCVICYEEVQGYPNTQTFWPPCCGRDAWLHRSCLQRMALSAGMHYLKCPLCNDKDHFYDAVCEQGYYLPDRDAAWELEQNAFAEMYERAVACGAADCRCPLGRAHDEPGLWDVELCVLCGSCGAHAACGGGRVCAACAPAAAGLDALERRLAAVIAAEQEREARVSSGPVMPSRMSLRRTKGRLAAHSTPSSSQNLPQITPASENKTESPKPEPITRQELNLKTPRRAKFLEPSVLKDLDNKLLSPIKMLEQSYMEKLGGMEDMTVNSKELIEKMRVKCNKPRPLCEKKRIVNEIIEDLFKNVFEDSFKSKEFAKEWISPKKCIGATGVYEENRKTEETANTEQNKKEKEIEIDIATHDSKSEDLTKMNEGDVQNETTATLDENQTTATLDENQTTATLDENQTTATLDENKENIKSTDDDNLIPVDDDDTVHDESSNSTFQLPPEFIAESDDSLPLFDTPKKLKTVDIQQNSSLEISEDNEVVNIDVVEIGSGKEKEFIKNLHFETPVKNKKCSFKFSPLNKERLQADNIDIDVESFKDQYLNEVGREFKCNFNHNHLKVCDTGKLKTVIDFAVDAAMSRKRKPASEKDEGTAVQKRRKVESEAERKKRKRFKKMKRKERERRKEKNHMKIKFKADNKSKKIKETVNKTFKQYVLKFSPAESSVKQIIGMPESDFTPPKRKYVKTEKSPDTLVQTSIQSFFKIK